jgi:hypothetical protein
MWQELDGLMYIIMEFIPGDTLESLWSNLTESNKTTIMKKLRSIFEQIRSLPSPGFYGNVSGGCLPYHLFWIAGNEKSVSGPFKSQGDFLLGLAKKSRINSANNNRHSYMAGFIERQLSLAFGNDYLPTFSHSDLQRKNIIVREIPSGDKNTLIEDIYVVSIVDWEVAGWYPSYWEYAAAFFAFKWQDDWLERVEEAIDAWGAETAKNSLSGLVAVVRKLLTAVPKIPLPWLHLRPPELGLTLLGPEVAFFRPKASSLLAIASMPESHTFSVEDVARCKIDGDV